MSADALRVQNFKERTKYVGNMTTDFDFASFLGFSISKKMVFDISVIKPK